ncbi:hypothetical protein [Clostridium thailandense]|uniref:hypothetical protein n=1 Tax=Clostridium thailandense TaxID=2794346 RepID=UPI0039890255
MKKKVIAIVILLALVVSAGIFMFNKNSATKTNASSKQIDFKIKSAFADVDSDMIIENTPKEDTDKKYDYIFVTFSNVVVDTKKDDSSNPLSAKSYTFDNNALPKGTVVTLKDANQVMIELPNGYLKGVNAPHSLKVSKDLKDKDGQTIKDSLEIKLPYSLSSTTNSNKQTESNTSAKKENTTDNSQKSDDKKSDNKTSSSSEKSNSTNSDMPKYSVKIMNTVPQTTIVAVTLDSSNPENYKVSVAGSNLELKTSNKGEKVFVGSTDKQYSFEEINKLIKIEKAK